MAASVQNGHSGRYGNYRVSCGLSFVVLIKFCTIISGVYVWEVAAPFGLCSMRFGFCKTMETLRQALLTSRWVGVGQNNKCTGINMSQTKFQACLMQVTHHPGSRSFPQLLLNCQAQVLIEPQCLAGVFGWKVMHACQQLLSQLLFCYSSQFTYRIVGNRLVMQL